MDDNEFFAMIEEEAVLLDRYGMTEFAKKMRACRSVREAAEVHQDVEAFLRMAKMVSR